MTTALQLRESDTMDDWQIMTQQASMLVKTGFLPQAIRTPEQAVAIILTGRELGIGTMAALNSIAVIQGKPTVSPQLMLALINRTNQVEDVSIQSGADGATCTIKRRGRSPYTARFGPKEAQAMGLSGKDNYKKQPATMYKWRAVAEAVRFTFSDVTLGLYTPEEMGATVDEEGGEVIEAAPVFESLGPAPSEAAEDLQGHLLEAEPIEAEPIPETQPTSAPLPEMAGAAGHVIKLANKLKWSEGDVIEQIHQSFGAVVMPGKLHGYLEFATKEELRELYRVMNSGGGKR